MGLLMKTGEYINFKSYTRNRVILQEMFINEEGIEDNKKDEQGNIIINDTLIFIINLNIFSNITKEFCQVVQHYVKLPYKEQISDSDVYNLLKTTSVSYSDVFGQEVILDLTKAEYLI